MNSSPDPLSYDAAVGLLSLYGADAAWTRHCIAVSRVAERAGGFLRGRCPLDQEHLRVGALLHDIGRSTTHDPVLHGVEGYRLLAGRGHHREARICASHILYGLSRDEAVRFGLPDLDFFPRTLEERLIPLIDGVVEFDRPTTLERRFTSLLRRYHDNPWFLERAAIAHERARAFLDELEREHGLQLERIAAEALR
jgi:putative nucleotidyltransferase with HDIG domain